MAMPWRGFLFALSGVSGDAGGWIDWVPGEGAARWSVEWSGVVGAG